MSQKFHQEAVERERKREREEESEEEDRPVKRAKMEEVIERGVVALERLAELAAKK